MTRYVLAAVFILSTVVRAQSATDLACGQDPGNRFFWIERGFCDVDVNPPDTAQGVIIWNHGLYGTTEAWRSSVPPVFRLLQARGWEVIVVKRHHLAEANGVDWSLSRAVRRT